MDDVDAAEVLEQVRNEIINRGFERFDTYAFRLSAETDSDKDHAVSATAMLSEYLRVLPVLLRSVGEQAVANSKQELLELLGARTLTLRVDYGNIDLRHVMGDASYELKGVPGADALAGQLETFLEELISFHDTPDNENNKPKGP